MRIKLKELGVGTKIIIYGQYRRVGGNNTILLTDIFNIDTKDFLCDHLWINKNKVPWNKEHNDFVVVYGTIYEYQKRVGIDYNVAPIAVGLIKPFVFHNTIVYMLSSEKYQTKYWFYARTKGFDSKTEIFDFETDEILHLFTGNDKQKGYEIIDETDNYYDIYYEYRANDLRVYKSLDKALSHIKRIE